MSDPIRTRRRGVERKGERKKVEWDRGGKEERGGGGEMILKVEGRGLDRDECKA